MTKDKSELVKKRELKLIPVISLICAHVWRGPEQLKKLCSYFFANALVILGCSGAVVLLPFVVSAQESVRVSWQPSPNTNAIGYNIYYGLSSGVYTREISAGDNTNVTISGLVDGAEYYFAATAYDSSGDESALSKEISFLVPTVVHSPPPPPPPPPPSSPTLTNGTYSGLFYESAIRPQSTGAFKLSVTTRGAYSGSLQMGKAQLRFSGLLGPSGQAAIQIPRKNTNALALIFSLGPSNQVSGAVSDGTWTASLYGELLMPRSAPKNAGKYMLVIQGNTPTSPSLGNGFGVLTVKSAQMLTLVAALADGTKLSQSASFTESGKCPVYVSLYSGNGLAMGWLTLANGSQDGSIGLVSWIKPPTPSLLYPGALAEQCATFGSVYNPALPLFGNLVAANKALGGAAAHNPTGAETALMTQ